MTQTFCPNCGSVVLANTKICPKCGNDLSPQNNKISPYQTKKYQGGWFDTTSQFWKLRKAITIIITILLIYTIFGSFLNLPYYSEVSSMTILLFIVTLLIWWAIKLLRRYLRVDSNKSEKEIKVPWHKKTVWRLLLLVFVLILITFPLWNPQKIYFQMQIRNLGDPTRRSQAMEVLTRQSGSTTINLLIDALGNSDPKIQSGANEALLKIGAPAVQPLIDALTSQKTGVSESAQKVLSAIGAPAVAPLLSKFMSTSDLNIEVLITRVLKSIGEPAIPALINALGNDSLNFSKMQSLQEILQEIGIPAVEPLIAAAMNGGTILRLNAIMILFDGGCITNKIGDGPILVCAPPSGEDLTQATNLLTSVLTDTNEGVRAAAVSSLEGLSWLGETRIDWLITALSDPSLTVNADAASPFQRIQDERSIVPLAKLLKEQDIHIQEVAILALAEQGQDGITTLLAGFDSGKMASVVSSYRQMIQAGDESQVPLMMAALFTTDEKNSEMAAEFLNCGKFNLENAAEKWADVHGYIITYYSTSQNPAVVWGSK